MALLSGVAKRKAGIVHRSRPFFWLFTLGVKNGSELYSDASCNEIKLVIHLAAILDIHKKRRRPEAKIKPSQKYR